MYKKPVNVLIMRGLLINIQVDRDHQFFFALFNGIYRATIITHSADSTAAPQAWTWWKNIPSVTWCQV